MVTPRHLVKRSARTTVSTLGIAALSAAFGTSLAFAQAANSGFDPLQPEKRFEALKQDQLRGTSSPHVPGVADSSGMPGPGGQLFTIRAFSISGNRAIPDAAIAPLYQQYLGRRISEADLAHLAEEITKLYRAQGYHLTRAIIPQQDVKEGIIGIKVIEGDIAELVVDGDPQGRFGTKALLLPLTTEQPSRQQSLERQLLLVNSLPGVRVSDTSLEEIGTASGRFRLTVYVKTWQVNAFVGVDNLGSNSVGPWQTYATAAFNSYIVAGDALTFNASTIATDPRQLGFGRLGYEAPIGIDGVRVGGSGLYSEVRPGDWRRQFGDVTRTQSFELHASAVALQSQRATLTFTAGAQFTDVAEDDIFGSLYRDHLRTISLSADSRVKDDFGGVNYLTATWRQGLAVLGASQAGDDFLSRDNGSGQFATVNIWFARYQTITDAWSVKVAAAAQYASSALLTSQQFYLGGASFGRGYGNAEISGDNAMAGSIELRYDGTLKAAYMRGYQFYGFIESGAAWNVGYNYTDGLSLTSAGAGLRLFFNGDLKVDLGVGVPLSYRSPDNPSRNPRFLLSISNAFRSCSARTSDC
jgi:hemolysin activation/secretion protein